MPGNIGRLIAKALERLGYTQAQLAKELGVAPATVGNWIRNGPPDARITELERILGPLRPQSRERDRAGLIAEALERLGYTQGQLARELGVTPATVGSWTRNGPPDARITELERILGPLRPQSEVAQWLRRERDRAGLTQGQLANRAKVSSLTISNTERGDTAPQRGTIAKLANALGVPPPGEGDCEGDNTSIVEPSGENQPVDMIGDMEDFLPHDQDERKRLLDGVMGVYVLTDKNENAVYVGMSGNDIGQRIRDHATRQWYNTQTIRYGKYIKVDNADICSRIESILIRLLRPQINKQHN